MMRLAILTFGQRDTPSTKYRMIDYLPLFAERGVEVDLFDKGMMREKWVWDYLASCDRIIAQKVLWSSSWAKRLYRLGIPVIYDLDDAIDERSPIPYSLWAGWRIRRRLRSWASGAACVTVANRELERRMQAINRSVKVVPMALDMDLWRPQPRHSDGKFRIGWAGAPGSHHLIEALDGPLCALIQRFPKVEIAIYSGSRPTLRVPHSYTAYTPGTEQQFTQQLDLGLLPLKDDPHCRCKSPIKAIQYLACGVPVVGNRFGATAEILDDSQSARVDGPEEWLPQLAALISAPERLMAMRTAARSSALEKHCLQANFELLYQLLC